MKLTTLLIAASLVANAVLLAGLFLFSPVSRSASDADARLSKTTATANAKIDPAFWRNVGGLDLPAQMARLRAAGVPADTMRAMMAVQIQETFAARRKALTPPSDPREFWKEEPPLGLKVRAALRELSIEQKRLTTELLGTTPDANPAQSLLDRRQYAGISDAKADQLISVQRDYDEMRANVMAGFSELALLPADRAKLALLEKEQRADLGQILSPQELEEYDLRTSNTASSLRSQLSAFHPTEAEFRTIFQQQRVLDDRYNRSYAELSDPFSPARMQTMQSRAEDQKQMIADIKAALGPERGAEYERTMDSNFQNISRVVERFGLPSSKAIEIWALQKDAQQQLRALQSNRQLDPDLKTAQLAALSTAVNAKLTATLGERALEVYKARGGAWVQSLKPRSAPSLIPAAESGGAGGSGSGTNTVPRTRP